MEYVLRVLLLALGTAALGTAISVAGYLLFATLFRGNRHSDLPLVAPSLNGDDPERESIPAAEELSRVIERIDAVSRQDEKEAVWALAHVLVTPGYGIAGRGDAIETPDGVVSLPSALQSIASVARSRAAVPYEDIRKRALSDDGEEKAIGAA